MLRRFFTSCGLVLALGTGCAGSQIGRIDEAEALLPKDLQDKFEVKDVSSTGAIDGAPKAQAIPADASVAQATPMPQASPVPGAGPQGGKKKKKRRRKGSDVVTTGATPESAGGSVVYPQRRPAKDPIWVGERHVFSVAYLGVSAGDLALEVLPYKSINNRKVYHIRGTATSSKVFSLFYRINDMLESYIDFDGLFSHRFHLVLDESKQTRDSLELFDNEKAQTFFWNRWNHKEKGYSEVKEYHEMAPFAQDSLSALYYLRTMPLPPGGQVSFPVVSEGKTWEAVATVVRREIYDGPNGPVPAIVIKPQTKYQGVLQQNKGDSYLWLSDDDRRFILRLEAKVRIGTVVIAAKEISGGDSPDIER